jgi:hypothetical protein
MPRRLLTVDRRFYGWTFVSTAATIVSGSVAERINFRCYLAFVLQHSLFAYPLLVHWTWSNQGFMSAKRSPDKLLFGCGVIDIAGSEKLFATTIICLQSLHTTTPNNCFSPPTTASPTSGCLISFSLKFCGQSGRGAHGVWLRGAVSTCAPRPAHRRHLRQRPPQGSAGTVRCIPCSGHHRTLVSSLS